MSLKPALQSILLKTSAATDLQYSGRELNVTGARRKINVDRIVSIKQEKYRAEVVQVVTAGAGSYTPQASTEYTYYIGDVNRVTQGGTEVLLPYSYTTPADLTTIGATAALQREYIHGQIIAKINANTSNYVTAATLGTGTGFTITDDAGYYPVHGQSQSNRLGATQVVSGQNPDGSGFTSASVSVTTAAVYSFGVGAKLLEEKPVMYNMAGNLASGVFSAPRAADGTYAVSGQNYDGFRIETLELQPAHNVTGQLALVEFETIIFVDNGTGTSTTNLAGFVAFEEAFHRLITRYNATPNPATIGEFFDSPTLFQGAAGAVPTTTGANKMVTEYGQLIYTQIGTQTITTPTPGNSGLILDQDLTATEGAEYTPSLLTTCPKEFVVGKTAVSVWSRVNLADYTDMAWLIGVRSKEANQADFNDYQNLAAVGSLAANGDLLTTQGILANAATVSTSTGVIPTDAADVVVEVKVDLLGAVTCKVNDVTFPVYSAGTTPLVFVAGTILIPFVRAVNIGGGDPDMVIKELLALPSTTWRI
jgi:hypothetical protein